MYLSLILLGSVACQSKVPDNGDLSTTFFAIDKGVGLYVDGDFPIDPRTAWRVEPNVSPEYCGGNAPLWWTMGSPNELGAVYCADGKRYIFPVAKCFGASVEPVRDPTTGAMGWLAICNDTEIYVMANLNEILVRTDGAHMRIRLDRDYVQQ